CSQSSSPSGAEEGHVLNRSIANLRVFLFGFFEDALCSAQLASATGCLNETDMWGKASGEKTEGVS
ncbi:6842_t:CDS:1, partial [Acaulospora colombiana]